jgi:hypothetical protein
MKENAMNKEDSWGSSWSGILALVLAFFGAIVSFWGALVTIISQGQIPEAHLWPLPGLVLIEWVLFTLIGFFIAYLCFRRPSAKWVRMAWLFTGTLIPLIISGAFSIGMAVMIAFLLFVISTIIFAVRQRSKLLESFSLLMLGSICNLGILMLMITLSNQSFY